MTSNFLGYRAQFPLTTLGDTVKEVFKHKGCESRSGMQKMPAGQSSGNDNRKWNARM